MSDSSMDRMMREAQQRMNDMYSRRSPIGGSGNNSINSLREPEREPHDKKIDEPKNPPPSDIIKPENQKNDDFPEKNIKPAAEHKKDNILEVLMKDKDRTIILCLILLLMDENADQSLLLALLYLLM